MRPLLLAILFLLVPVPAAGASCAEGIVSGDRFLQAVPSGNGALPPDDREVDAAWPACNDTNGSREVDRPTSATKLRGIPADVAVRKGSTVYLDFDSLVPVRGHPLRDAVAYVVPRRRAPCRRERLQGRAHATGSGIEIRRRSVFVDRRTRITSRPAYQPVNSRQRLDVRVSRCGRRRFADTITFVGRTVAPGRYEPDFGGAVRRSVPYLVPLALLLAAAAVVVGAIRRG